MPLHNLTALLDDITLLLDDVATMTKLATKKTAGVLGDDLALNAQQLTGLRAERELPVVLAVARGSLRNKAILVPAALAISALAPWAVIPLLMVGGAYLCFEGVEKLAHKFLHAREAEEHEQKLHAAVVDPSVDLVALEKDRIKGAVRTDFILSAEILVISLGSVATAGFGTRVAVLVAIALIMTVGVYGFVGGIVKLDDVGLRLRSGRGAVARKLGAAILAGAPWLMKFLSVAGTAAMFLVGGGIVVHGVKPLHHLIKGVESRVDDLPRAGEIVGTITEALLEGLSGVVVGVIVLLVVTAVKKVVGRKRDATAA